MAVMLGGLYHALLAGGAPAEQAEKAVEEVARYEADIGAIKGELALIKWMVGFVIALVVSLLVLQLRGH